MRDAGNLLTRAGFTLPSVDVDQYTVKYNSCKHCHSQFSVSCYFPYITCIEVQISVLVWNIRDIRSSMRINTVYLFALLFLKIKENANFDGFRGGGGGVVCIEFLTYLLSMLRLLSHSLVHHLLFLLLSVWCSTGADRTSACDG